MKDYNYKDLVKYVIKIKHDKYKKELLEEIKMSEEGMLNLFFHDWNNFKFQFEKNGFKELCPIPLTANTIKFNFFINDYESSFIMCAKNQQEIVYYYNMQEYLNLSYLIDDIMKGV